MIGDDSPKVLALIICPRSTWVRILIRILRATSGINEMSLFPPTFTDVDKTQREGQCNDPSSSARRSPNIKKATQTNPSAIGINRQMKDPNPNIFASSNQFPSSTQGSNTTTTTIFSSLSQKASDFEESTTSRNNYLTNAILGRPISTKNLTLPPVNPLNSSSLFARPKSDFLQPSFKFPIQSGPYELLFAREFSNRTVKAILYLLVLYYVCLIVLETLGML